MYPVKVKCVCPDDPQPWKEFRFERNHHPYTQKFSQDFINQSNEKIWNICIIRNISTPVERVETQKHYEDPNYLGSERASWELVELRWDSDGS